MAMADSSSLDLDIGLFGDDVLTEILSRLPVKSVLRFKCVSKFWFALIKSSHLIKKHLQHNHTTLKNGNAPLFCVRDNQFFEDLETNSRIPILSWISSNNTNDETTTVVDVPSTDPILHSHVRIIVHPRAVMMGPVNGIYCTNGMHLYNPSLREVKVIPPIPMMTEEYQLSEAYYLATSGFGYDPNANDYKVIKIICFRSSAESRNRLLAESSNCCQAFLYSLRSNSWRKFESDYIKSLSRQVDNASSVSHGNGVTHWLMIDDADENGFAILSFDFVNEAFLRSSLPEALDDKLKGYTYMSFGKLCRYQKNYTIAVLNDESIALIIMLHGSLRSSGWGFSWEVWVMKEYGVKESWTKLFATGHLPQLYPFLGFANNNREIFFNNKERQLVSYDPYRQQTKNLHIHALQVRTYMESLVSIVNGGY